MIEGIKIDVPGTELVAHAKKRAERNRMKAKQYDEKAAMCDKREGESDDAPTPEQMYSNKAYQTVRQQLISSAKMYRGRAEYFEFLAGHTVESETYRLKEDDIRHLEFILDA